MNIGFKDGHRKSLDSPQSDIPLEQRYRLLIEAVTDYAIFMLDPSGHIATWNTGAQKIKGYPADEIIGRHFSVFYTPEDVAANKPRRELAIATSQGSVEDEGWRVRRDGSRFWANVVITAMHDASGTLCGFAKVTRDMTERRRLIELEHASELTAEIQRTREEEQKRIARELHDDIGQQLTALKMAVALHEGSLCDIGGSRQLLSETRELQAQIDAMAASVRRLAANLRPPILDDLGLVAALEWLTDDFSRRYGVKVEAHLGLEDLAFTDFASTAIFRMVQEALTNVARHAQASRVSVELTRTGSVCIVRVEDDGAGTTPGAARKNRSFGLLGMRERVRQLNGKLSIDSAPGYGFRLAIQLPVTAIESGYTG